MQDQLARMIGGLNQGNQQLFQRVNSAFPKAIVNGQVNPEAVNFASQMATGMTSQPIPRGDLALARQLAQKQQSLNPITLEEFQQALKSAKTNLQIPDKILKKMKLQDILAEILGAAEKPR